MLFTERKQFLYDTKAVSTQNVRTALKIACEYVRKFSPQVMEDGALRYPRWFEVDDTVGKYDALWHMPLSPRTQFSRILEIPCINSFDKPDWRLTKLGITPIRRDKFWTANLDLERLNYFPQRGDLVYFNGYRYMVDKVVLEPNAYFGQSGVWTGLSCECIIPPEGDAKPLLDPGSAAPAELGTSYPAIK